MNIDILFYYSINVYNIILNYNNRLSNYSNISYDSSISLLL